MPEPADARDQRERRFRSLYQEYYRPLQAYAVRRMDAQADVADVVADVFTTAWRRLDDIPSPPDDRLWLYGVARRVIAGKHRGRQRLRNLLTRLEAHHDGSTGPSRETADSLNERLLAALRRLGSAEREALQLVLWEQLSHAEAAEVLGCSANAVAIRVHRAKAKLRDTLGPGPGAGEPAGSGPAGGHAAPACSATYQPNGS
ncbi:MAG TPA: sigma-70 family RNA polymerase sigma factor [Streptosporangiaceae bacterium]